MHAVLAMHLFVRPLGGTSTACSALLSTPLIWRQLSCRFSARTCDSHHHSLYNHYSSSCLWTSLSRHVELNQAQHALLQHMGQEPHLIVVNRPLWEIFSGGVRCSESRHDFVRSTTMPTVLSTIMYRVCSSTSSVNPALTTPACHTSVSVALCTGRSAGWPAGAQHSACARHSFCCC